MLKKTFLQVILLLIPLAASAQQGNPYLNHYTGKVVGGVQNWSITQDSSNNMFFANRKGLLRYNGETWKTIHTPSLPYALLTHPETGDLYIGAENDIGYLTRGKKGQYQYHSLVPDTSVSGAFTHIELVDSVLYFMSSKNIVRIDPEKRQQQKKWVAGEQKPFTGMVHNNEHVFINLWREGLHRLQSDTLFPIVSGYKTRNREILFSFPYDSSLVLLGTDENKLFLFDGMKFYPYTLKNQSYIEESILSGGRKISSRYFALSTLAGGVLVVDKTSREVAYTINYKTGLPDDEVTAMAVDRNQGLWISHASGISRAATDLPVRNFSTYPGIEGKLIRAAEVDSTLYLATGAGIFRLKEEKKYTSREITVKVKEKVPAAGGQEKTQDPAAGDRERGQTQKEGEQEEEQEGEQEKEKVGQEQANQEEGQKKEEDEPGAFRKFFNRIFGKKDKKKDRPGTSEKQKKSGETRDSESQDRSSEATAKPKAQKEGPGAASRPQTRISYRKKKIYSLQSVTHKFEKIEPVGGKCDVLFTLPGEQGLLAGTHEGLYYIDPKGRASMVRKDIHPQHIISFRNKETFLVGATAGMYEVYRNNGLWEVRRLVPDIEDPVYSTAYDPESRTLWAGSEDKAYRIIFGRGIDPHSVHSYSIPTNYSEKYHVNHIDRTPHLLISSGIYRYQATTDTFAINDTVLSRSDEPSEYQYLFSSSGLTLVRQGNKWRVTGDAGNQKDHLVRRYLRLFNDLQSVSLTSQGHLLVVAGNQLYRIDLDQGLPQQESFEAFFTSIRLDGERQGHHRLEIDKENTSLEFTVAAPHYIKENTTRYQYRIKGLMNEWSEWSDDPTLRIFTQKGEYTVQARARNIWGQVSETSQVSYEVPPPFTETAYFYGVVVVVVAGLFFLVIKLHERKLQHDKKVLEEAIKARTATIEEQKSEITTQRDAILQQKKTIEQKNREITGSIEYARRIQTALLPGENTFQQAFSDHFIIFKPRSIVSGDFYWIHSNEKRIYLTAADCTGHGVPGAFMSMLGISSLNEIVTNHKGNPESAAEILNRLRETVKNSLHQTGKKDLTKDGMDMAFCVVDLENNKMDFAGAFNPLYIFRNGVFEQYSGDRNPVGIYHTEKATFTNHRVDIKPGDTFYLFSDGYIDQLGGPNHKKFKSKNFISLLKDIHHLPLSRQKEILEQEFDQWKGDNFQVDDVIVLGIRI